MLEVGTKVEAKGLEEWGIGEIISTDGDTYETEWPASEDEGNPYSTTLWPEQLTPVNTESPNLGEEQTMERLFELEQSVHDAGGNLGLISSYEERDNGIFYRVLWEDGKETLNIQSVLQPVIELKKSTPTPKEVRQVVETKAPENEAESVIEAWDLNFSLGNVVQSVYNASQDSSLELQELERAAYYLNRRINKLEAK